MITFLHDDEDKKNFFDIIDDLEFDIIDDLEMSYKMTVTEAENVKHLMELYDNHIHHGI